jgi:hypothetical protein
MHLTMRRTHQVLLGLLAASLLTAPAAHAAQREMLSGDYEGKGAGIKATVIVGDDGDGKVRFSMKAASCGTVKGSVALDPAPGGAMKGKRASGDKTEVVRISSVASAELSGSVRYVGVDSDDDVCKAKRTFDATLDADSSDEVAALTGHYSGTGDDGGRPISFDVAYDRGEGALAVKNLSFQSDTECWMDLDGDGEDDNLVAKIDGLSGEVDADGYFEIDVTPDDDTEYYVEGTLEDGEADLYLEVGGFFAADGTPQADGPLECDSWGEDYFAAKDA